MPATHDKPYVIEMFYDGGCPLCVRETNLWRRWDQQHQIRFTNIDAPDFQAIDYGKTQDEFMAQMHGRLVDGTWVRGVEVFRRLYSIIGWKMLVAVSRWPIISQLLDLGYAVYAKNRLRLTGRCTADGCSIDHKPIKTKAEPQAVAESNNPSKPA